MSTNTRRWVWAGAVLLVAGVGFLLAPRGSGGTAEESAPAAGTESAGGQGGRQTSASQVTAANVPQAELPQPVPCDLASLLEEYRQGKHSPAYRRYVMEQLRGLLPTLPPEELWARLEGEQDPEMFEVLASLWVERFNLNADKGVLTRVLERVGREPDVARRAALVRSLRSSHEPSSQLLAKTSGAYHELVKDPAPEVRQAIIENLTAEAARNFGRFQGVAEEAVALATETTDPKTAAGLLKTTSIEAARGPAVATVRNRLLSSEHPEVRAAAAQALGTVSVGEAEQTMRALSERYVAERERTVRSAILQGIVQLGLVRAVPVLQRLKGVDPNLDTEIDLWLSLLADNPQTWNLLLRDKQARERTSGG